jgi:hypothetical protein
MTLASMPANRTGARASWSTRRDYRSMPSFESGMRSDSAEGSYVIDPARTLRTKLL